VFAATTSIRAYCRASTDRCDRPPENLGVDHGGREKHLPRLHTCLQPNSSLAWACQVPSRSEPSRSLQPARVVVGQTPGSPSSRLISDLVVADAVVRALARDGLGMCNGPRVKRRRLDRLAPLVEQVAVLDQRTPSCIAFRYGGAGVGVGSTYFRPARASLPAPRISSRVLGVSISSPGDMAPPDAIILNLVHSWRRFIALALRPRRPRPRSLPGHSPRIRPPALPFRAPPLVACRRSAQRRRRPSMRGPVVEAGLGGLAEAVVGPRPPPAGPRRW